jgi:hypothetical protein
MSKQIVLLVHGMGTHEPGKISEIFTKALTDRANCFELNFDLTQEDCQLEEYNYSEHFDAIRQQFADNAAAMQTGFSYLSGGGLPASLIQYLTEQEAKFSKDEFLYTHWLDVLLYSSTYFGEQIRAQFAQKYHELGTQHGHDNLHVVCHSLGTAVVHDSFAKLYRHGANIFDGIPDYEPGNFNSKTLWTFANVSRLVNLLNDLEKPSLSTVTAGGDGCTNYLFNIRHQLDPFTWFKTYQRQAAALRHIENDVVRNINTHDFYEYVTAPEVARELFAKIFEKAVAPDKYLACEESYRQDSLSGDFDELKAALEEIRDNADFDNLKKAFEAGKKLAKAVKETGGEL